MLKVWLAATLALLIVGVMADRVQAGLPRGIELVAGEQIADEATGTTIARGNAEIRSGLYKIHGTASIIEVRPPINEILLKGGARLSAGTRHYAAETLSCTLDFERCVAVDGDQPLPASAFGSAETTPR